MTENEAIKDLGIVRYNHNWDEFSKEKYFEELITMIRNGREEIQAYRAIGTVEQLKTMFDGFWKLKDLCEEYEKYGLPEDYWKLNEMFKEYSAIGTIEEFKALKEKSVAKKVVSKGQGHEADCYCPNCNAFLGNDQDFCFSHTNYCTECGQALET